MKNYLQYSYTRETARYAFGGSAAGGSYDRGGYLSLIEYGEHRELVSNGPTAAVEFTTVGRCVEAIGWPATGTASCPVLTRNASQVSYPDVPTDLVCAVGEQCDPLTQSSPTFFTDQRLARITAKVRDAAGDGFTATDRVDFGQDFYDSGAGQGPELRLTSLQPTGLTGAAPVSTPAVRFGWCG